MGVGATVARERLVMFTGTNVHAAWPVQVLKNLKNNSFFFSLPRPQPRNSGICPLSGRVKENNKDMPSCALSGYYQYYVYYNKKARRARSYKLKTIKIELDKMNRQQPANPIQLL